VTRDFVDVLSRPYVLSQRPLLTEKQFMDESSKRGLRLFHSGQLANLHKDQLLVPLFRFDRPTRRLRAEARRAEDWRRWAILNWPAPVYANSVTDRLDDGTLVLARTQTSRGWSNRERMEGDVGFLAREFVFSAYQLLTLHRLRDALESKLALRAGAHPPEWTAGVIAAARGASLQNDATVALLTALEPIYFPLIMQRLTMPLGSGSFEDYDAFARGFDPVELYQWLDWQSADLQKVAEALLWEAHSHDPLKNWRELVSHIHPEHWAQLEGEGLLAIDLRVAAEMILRFLEDLAKRGEVAPLPAIPRLAYHPLGDRLRPERRDLDGVLTDFGLSPHPSVLFVVEGPTEDDLLPKVMHLLGIPVRDSLIRIVQLGGVDKQIELLARYIAPPLRRLNPEMADMVRPPLRVFVVMDAEGRYSTDAMRSARKTDWVMHIWNRLEPEFQTQTARDDLELMVDVTTWDPAAKDLEFAHFTPRQLARAVIRTRRAPPAETVNSLTAAIANLQATTKSVDKLWRKWPQPQPDMPTLWLELWPVLERRILKAMQTRTVDQIPICRVLVDAYERAARPRRHAVMRVGSAPSDRPISQQRTNAPADVSMTKPVRPTEP